MEKEINIENIMNAFAFIGKAAEKAQSLLDNGYAEERKEAQHLALALGMGKMVTDPAIHHLIKDLAKDIEAKQKLDFEISNRACPTP